MIDFRRELSGCYALLILAMVAADARNSTRTSVNFGSPPFHSGLAFLHDALISGMILEKSTCSPIFSEITIGTFLFASEVASNTSAFDVQPKIQLLDEFDGLYGPASTFVAEADIDVLISPPFASSSLDLLDLYSLVKATDISLISWADNNHLLADLLLDDHHIQMDSDVGAMGNALKRFLQFLIVEWDAVSVLFSNGKRFVGSASSLYDSLEEGGVEVNLFREMKEDVLQDDLIEEIATMEPHAIVLIGDCATFSSSLYKAREKGVYYGNVWILLETQGFCKEEILCWSEEENVPPTLASQLFDGVFVLNWAGMETLDLEHAQNVLRRSSSISLDDYEVIDYNPPSNASQDFLETEDLHDIGSLKKSAISRASYLFDAIKFYFDDSLVATSNIKEGSFEGVSGRIHYNFELGERFDLDTDIFYLQYTESVGDFRAVHVATYIERGDELQTDTIPATFASINNCGGGSAVPLSILDCDGRPTALDTSSTDISMELAVLLPISMMIVFVLTISLFIILGSKDDRLSITESLRMCKQRPNSSDSANLDTIVVNIDEKRIDRVQSNALESIKEVEINPREIEMGPIIGMGSFAQVHSAQFQKDTVAVKILHEFSPESVRKFAYEVGIMMQLNHPNIIRLVGASWTGGSLMIIVERAKYGNLAQVLKSDKLHLTWRDHKLQMAMDIASGMAFLHQIEHLDMASKKKDLIIHRDLKPQNLLVMDDFRIKITDFGEARVREMTSEMTQVGTLYYVAPEILRNHKYDEKCDVYSFAIVLLAMLQLAPDISDVFAKLIDESPSSDDQNHDKEKSGKNAVFLITAKIVNEEARPVLPARIPESLRILIEESWRPNPTFRPSFAEIKTFLTEEVRDEILNKYSSFDDEDRLKPEEGEEKKKKKNTNQPFKSDIIANARIEESRLSIPDVRVENYLFSGVFADFWSAKLFSAKIVAKELVSESEDMQRKFVFEVSMMKNLKHPNIVQMLGACWDIGSLMIILDTFNEMTLWRVSRDICRGMAYLHNQEYFNQCEYRMEKGIVHGDLTCSNIIVEDEMRVKITGFADSRFKNIYVDNYSDEAILYLAPEILQEIIDERNQKSDVYSFIVIMYRMMNCPMSLKNILALNMIKHCESHYKKSCSRLKVEKIDITGRISEEVLEEIDSKSVVECVKSHLLRPTCSREDPFRSIIELGKRDIDSLPGFVEILDMLERLKDSIS